MSENQEPLEVNQQVILPTVVDHVLQPDALRGSEWVYNTIKDSDGNRIEVRDMEQERRDFQRKATETKAPLMMRESGSVGENWPAMAPTQAALDSQQQTEQQRRNYERTHTYMAPTQAEEDISTTESPTA